MAKSEMSKRE